MAEPLDKPLLYLDVDGVLNPVRPTGACTAHRIVGHTVLLPDDHPGWLRELAGAYSLVWATTWEHHANRYLAPLLGLEPLPVVEFTGYRPRPDDPRLPVLDLLSGHKWAPILRHAAGRPFAWLDDVIPASLVRRSHWWRDRVLLPVDPGEGLLRAHVDRLLDRPPGPRRILPPARRAPRRPAGNPAHPGLR